VSSYAGSSDGVRVTGEYSPATLLKRDAGQYIWLNLYDLASPDFSAARLVGAAGESGTTHPEIRGIPTKVVSMMINQSLLQQKRKNHRTFPPKNMWSCPIIHSMGIWSPLSFAELQRPMSIVR